MGYNNVISRDNVLLFGDSAIAIQPHLAQGGNQILNDALYIKKSIKSEVFVESFISNFVQKSLKFKRKLKRNSEAVGKIFGLNKALSIPRNFIISKFSDEILNDFFSLIWKDKYDV